VKEELAVEARTIATGSGVTLAGPEVGRGKNAPPAADPRPTFTYRGGRAAVARWTASGRIFTRCDDRAASRAPPSSPPLPGRGCQRARGRPCHGRPAGPAAPAPAPPHCGVGTRRSRKSGGAIPRGEFRPRVLVAASHPDRFEPRDGCRAASTLTRRGVVRVRAEADFRRAAPAPSGTGRRAWLASPPWRSHALSKDLPTSNSQRNPELGTWSQKQFSWELEIGNRSRQSEDVDLS
jgi:hypothetical protein